MNKLKTGLKRGWNTFGRLKDPMSKTQAKAELRGKALSYSGMKKAFILTGAAYFGVYFFSTKYDIWSSISRMTGKFTQLRLPKVQSLKL